MTYRVEDLEIISGNPFQHDMLERREFVKSLSDLIEGLNGPFVMALDSPFGSGKTTLIHMLIEDMKKKECRCTYFNAWEVDYATDPLVALVSSIDSTDPDQNEADSKYREHLKKVKEKTTALAKPVLFALVKGSTSGMLDLEELSKALPSETKNIVDQFTDERRSLNTFKEELTNAVKLFATNKKGPGLIIFIDELDRCRPTFAIHLLERIKHVFNIPNIIFVLAIDKKQIEASTKAVYGAEVNATEYLRRFFDLEFGIPVPETQRFTDNLITRFNLDSLFDQRTSAHTSFESDRQHFVGTFDLLANAMDLSLRAREKCITRLRIVMEQTSDNQHLNPILVALLIVLRSNNPDLYGRIVAGDAKPEEVIDFLTSLPGGKIKKSDYRVDLIHAYLLISFPDRELAMKWQEEIISAGRKGDQQAKSIVQILNSIMGGHGRDISLVKVAQKIDFASWVK